MDQLSKKLNELLSRSIELQQYAGGNVIVLKNGKEIAYAQAGYADIENKRPFERDTIIRLYSMSKPITACACMILMERGLIDPSDRVEDYIPNFSNMLVREQNRLVKVDKPIRIADLLNMTAGFSYGDSNTPEIAEVLNNLRQMAEHNNSPTTMEVVNEMFACCPLDFQPRSSWKYSVCADIIGAVIEVVTNKNFGEFLYEEIFKPLDMVDTGFFVPQEKQNRLAKVYESTENGLRLYSDSYLGVSNKMLYEPRFQSGGAGLCSTLEDYSHFTTMLLNGGKYNGKQILSPKMVDYFTKGELLPWQQEVMNRTWDSFDGFTYHNFLRIMKNPKQADTLSTMGEYGWDGWLGAYFVNSPEDDISMIFMMQHTDTGTTPLVRKLKNQVWLNI